MTRMIEIEQHQGWAEIVMNRPLRRNAMVPSMAAEIEAAVEGLSKVSEVAAIILRGSEGCFSSGIDLKALQSNEDPGSDDGSWNQTALKSLHFTLYRSTKPLICALEKFAINAGAALVFACDLVVAGNEAFLQVGEIQQGADIPMNAAWLRLKSSEQTLSRLALLGDRVSASELAQMGLIQKVVGDEEVVTCARAWAGRLASFPEGASETIVSRIRGFRPDDVSSVFPESTNSALLSAGLLKR
jgi:enoyl-CoA hydratase/carnithine racemase